MEKHSTEFLGLDVHKESTAIGRASAGRAAGRFVGTVGAALAELLKSLKSLGRPEELPGQRTLGELLQERGWAVQEIGRLRLELMRWTQSAAARKQAHQPKSDEPEAKTPPIAGRLLRLPEVMKIAGVSRSTIYMRIDAGVFPQAIRLGERSVAWRGEDILAWQQSLPERRKTVGPNRLRP